MRPKVFQIHRSGTEDPSLSWIFTLRSPHSGKKTWRVNHLRTDSTGPLGLSFKKALDKKEEPPRAQPLRSGATLGRVPWQVGPGRPEGSPLCRVALTLSDPCARWTTGQEPRVRKNYSTKKRLNRRASWARPLRHREAYAWRLSVRSPRPEVPCQGPMPGKRLLEDTSEQDGSSNPVPNAVQFQA